MGMLYVRAKSNISDHRLSVALNVWSAANVCLTEHVSIKNVLTHVLEYVEIMPNVTLSTTMPYVVVHKIMSVIHLYIAHTKKVSELITYKPKKLQVSLTIKTNNKTENFVLIKIRIQNVFIVHLYAIKE